MSAATSLNEASINRPIAPERILRIGEVMHRSSLSRSSIYREMSRGRFPKPIPVGEHARGWLESEVTRWIAERLRERDP